MVKFMFLGPFGRLMPEEDEEGYWLVDCAGKRVDEIVNTTKVAESSMNYAVIVNDRQKEQDYIMVDGDEVNILPLFHAG